MSIAPVPTPMSRFQLALARAVCPWWPFAARGLAKVRAR